MRFRTAYVARKTIGRDYFQRAIIELRVVFDKRLGMFTLKNMESWVIQERHSQSFRIDMPAGSSGGGAFKNTLDMK